MDFFICLHYYMKVNKVIFGQLNHKLYDLFLFSLCVRSTSRNSPSHFDDRRRDTRSDNRSRAELRDDRQRFDDRDRDRARERERDRERERERDRERDMMRSRDATNGRRLVINIIKFLDLDSQLF